MAAAEIYESEFVPALFAEWAPHLVDFAGVRPGQAVLDVACGTGIVARTVADRLGGAGRVVGLDLNPAMLASRAGCVRTSSGGKGTPRRCPSRTGRSTWCSARWRSCSSRSGRRPPRDAAGRRRRRHRRRRRPGAPPAQPAYAPFVEMAARHAGPDAVSVLGAYFSCGDLGPLTSLVESAGLAVAGTRAHLGRVKCASVDEFVTAEVESTPLAGRIGAGRVRAHPRGRPRGAAAVHDAGRPSRGPLAGHLVAGRR